jgi:hypothetical protein
MNGGDHIHTVILDEAHHAVASTWRAVLEDLGAFSEDGPLCVGFTATPERADGKALGDLFPKVVYQRSILEMIEAGYLVDVRGLRVRLEGLDLRTVKRVAGDYQDGDLGRALENADAPTHAVCAYLEHAEGRKAIVFTPTVNLAVGMADAFRTAGVPAGWVSGTMPLSERRAALSLFQSGELRVVANAMVLTEGFDEPSCDCIIVARPTRSHGLYVQQVGRGTRPYPGKDDLLVLDLVGASEDNRLQTVVDLVGRDAGVSPFDGESLLEAIARGKREELEAVELADARIRAEVVDLFGRSLLHWLELGPNRYLLPLGDGSLLLERSGEQWAVRSRVKRGETSRARTIWVGSDLGYAQGMGEDYARRVGAGGLVNARARWREEPATPKQLWHLRRSRIPVPVGLTKGHAADLLSVAFAQKDWGGAA